MNLRLCPEIPLPISKSHRVDLAASWTTIHGGFSSSMDNASHSPRNFALRRVSGLSNNDEFFIGTHLWTGFAFMEYIPLQRASGLQ